MKYILIILLFITSVSQAQKKPVKRAVAPVRKLINLDINIKDIPQLQEALDSLRAKQSVPKNLSSFKDDVGYFKKYFQFVTRATNFTLSLADDGKFINVPSTTPITITIPASKTVAFKPGTQITISQKNTGPVIFAAEPGVTILTVDKGIQMTKVNALVTLIYEDNNTWQIAGDLQP